MRAAAVCVLAAVTVGGAAEAQWAKVRDDSVQWSSDGSAVLSGRTPRVRGRPDLSGVWLPNGDPLPPGIEAIETDLRFPRHMINITADLPPDSVQMTPWATTVFEERLAAGGTDQPTAHCQPTGVPWLNAVTLPYKIVQTPDLVLVLYEESTVFRQIFLDGRKPVDDPVPRYMGYSTGRWEGDDLVVETTAISENTWLDGMGHHRAEAPLLHQLRLPQPLYSGGGVAAPG